jgi:proline iminopeptidase
MAYPPLEPHDRGMLAVGDGQRIRWEVSGNPDGRPAVALHGGPGSGCAPWWRELFDPAAHRIVLFDQRGAGGSLPDAADPATDLSVITTHHLIADLERLRAHLGIERWLVVGGSWGSTLALAYAQRHPERVTELVLFSVGTTTRREVAWLTRGVGSRFPRAWARFAAGVPDEPDLAAAYARALADPERREQAARDWCAWEDAHVGGPHDPRYDDPRFRLRFARLVTHFWSHAAWLGETELLDGMPLLASIPGVLIHGRRDISSPLDVPAALARAWPGAELVVIEDEGHGAGARTSAAIVAATDRFSRGARLRARA